VGPDSDRDLKSLASLQRANLHHGRVERDFDPAKEAVWLDAIESAPMSDEVRDSAEAWLIGTLPVEVYGPPLLLSTRAREEAQLEMTRGHWIVGLRWFLLGGGTLFLLILGRSFAREHARISTATRAALVVPDADQEDLRSVTQVGRDLWIRAVLTVVFVAVSLSLTAYLMEKLLWHT
jgi:hypothetical protein